MNQWKFVLKIYSNINIAHYYCNLLYQTCIDYHYHCCTIDPIYMHSEFSEFSEYARILRILDLPDYATV